MLAIRFRDKIHQIEYETLVEQMELSEGELENPTQILKRQLAFVYLIALYQKEYEVYEGCKFYIEVYEDISIDGPVYLLDDQVELNLYPHERMLKVAKCLISGKEIAINEVEAEEQEFVEEAIRLTI